MPAEICADIGLSRLSKGLEDHGEGKEEVGGVLGWETAGRGHSWGGHIGSGRQG